VVLIAGGAFMIWRGVTARGVAPAMQRGDTLLGERMAVVWILVGALALVTAVGAALSLRPRRRGRTLRLDEPHHPPGGARRQ
jgi:hypothetical protein